MKGGRGGEEAQKEAEKVGLRVLSLGAGVQSSTLLLMACEGEEHLDAAIFADTGWEPAAVYQHLDWLEGKARAATIPLYRVGSASLRADALANKTMSWMPLYDDARSQLKRQCTRNYKIRPIRRQVRALGGGPNRPVQQLVGISLDEWHRMRDSDVGYITNVYPLVDRRMTRHDCLNWLARHGYPTPPRSHCVGCPFRTNREWRDLTPAEWEDAVDFDARIRSVRSRTERREVFLHRSAVPLPLVDLSTEQERGQLDMFEQSDGCGVLCPSEGAA